MKWDKKNRERLYAILLRKRGEFGTDSYRWKQFLDSLGIDMVSKREQGDPWQIADYESLSYGELARSNKHIIIDDPFNLPWEDKGIRVPKDVAEKILVLGIP